MGRVDPEGRGHAVHAQRASMSTTAVLGRRIVAVLALGLVAVAAACGDDDVGDARHVYVREGRRHDLLTRLDRAEIESPLAPRMLLRRDTTVDVRDGPGLLRAPSRTRITFPPLTTHGPARLEVHCGLADPAATSDIRAPVLFRVEARDANGERQHVAERLVIPEELQAPTHAEPWTVELPGSASRAWQLTLTTRTPEGAIGRGDWAAWIGPELHAKGRRLPRAERPVRTWSEDLDLLAALPVADIAQLESVPAVALDLVDPAKGTAWGGPRRALTTHGPTRLAWTLTPAPGARLTGAVAVDQRRGWNAGSDGVSFEVRVDGETQWALHVDPRSDRAQRRWFELDVDLSSWAGRDVALELRSEPGQSVTADVAGWADVAVRSPREAPRRTVDGGPHVFVIVVDTLRADRLGCYGSARELTPRLDAFAAEAMLFDRARSVSSWTLPSTATLLTGLWPTEHGSLDDSRPRLDVQLDTLAEHFAGAGWTTGAFVANPLVGRERHFDQGFETFLAMPDARAGTLVEHMLDWVDDHRGSALLGYLHLLDPHTPYAAPPGYGPSVERTPKAPGRELSPPADVAKLPADKRAAGVAAVLADRDAYDAEVSYVDAALGRLLDGLRERGQLQDAVVVITSDHGEEFLEHGSLYHGNQLYDESVKVPLMIAGLGASAARVPAQRSDAAATLRDVLPTLLELCDLPVPDGLSVPLLDPRVPSQPQFAVTTRSLAGVAQTTASWSVVTWPHKLILRDGAAPELFDLARDPFEQDDLAARMPDAVQALTQRLDAWCATARPVDGSAPLDEDTRIWMEQLGYLGK